MAEFTYSHSKAALITGIIRILYFFAWMVYWIYVLDLIGKAGGKGDAFTYPLLNFFIALVHFGCGFLLAYAAWKMNKLFTLIWVIITTFVFLIFLVYNSIAISSAGGGRVPADIACWFALTLILDVVSLVIGFLFWRSDEMNQFF